MKIPVGVEQSAVCARDVARLVLLGISCEVLRLRERSLGIESSRPGVYRIYQHPTYHTAYQHDEERYGVIRQVGSLIADACE